MKNGEFERILTEEEGKQVIREFIHGPFDAEKQKQARTELMQMLDEWRLEELHEAVKSSIGTVKSKIQDWNKWIDELLSELVVGVSVVPAAATENKDDSEIRKEEIKWHLENRERRIQCEVYEVGERLRVVIISNDEGLKFKSFEKCGKNGSREKLAEVKDNLYAKVNLSQNKDSIHLTEDQYFASVTEDNQIVELAIIP